MSRSLCSGHCLGHCILVAVFRSLVFWFLKSPRAPWSYFCQKKKQQLAICQTQKAILFDKQMTKPEKWQLSSGDKLDHWDPQAAIQFVAEKEPGQIFYPLNGIFSRVKMTCKQCQKWAMSTKTLANMMSWILLGDKLLCSATNSIIAELRTNQRWGKIPEKDKPRKRKPREFMGTKRIAPICFGVFANCNPRKMAGVYACRRHIRKLAGIYACTRRNDVVTV